MTLLCSCDFDISDYDYWQEGDSGFQPFVSKRRKRCCSCNSLIEINASSVEFYYFRSPRDEIEERIHGDQVSLASDHMCEECAGLYYALSELGYDCLNIRHPMKEHIKELNRK